MSEEQKDKEKIVEHLAYMLDEKFKDDFEISLREDFSKIPNNSHLIDVFKFFYSELGVGDCGIEFRRIYWFLKKSKEGQKLIDRKRVLFMEQFFNKVSKS